MSTRRPMGPRDLARASSIKASDIEASLVRTLSEMGGGKHSSQPSSSSSTDGPPTLPPLRLFRTPSPQPPQPSTSRTSPRKAVPPLEPEYVFVDSSPSNAPLSRLAADDETPQHTPRRPMSMPVVEPLTIRKKAPTLRNSESAGSSSRTEATRSPSPTRRPFPATRPAAEASSPTKRSSSSRLVTLAEDTWEDVRGYYYLPAEFV